MAANATKAVRFSLEDNGEIVQNSNKVPETKAPPSSKEPEFYIFQLISEFSDKYGVPQFPETYSLSSTSILQDENGNQRAANFIEGVPTLWVDEQKDLPDSLKKRRADITFHKGLLRVKSGDKLLVKFLLERPDSAQTKSSMKSPRAKYSMLNFPEIEKALLVKTQRKHEAMKMALNSEGEQMIKHAKFLGVKFSNAYGIPKTEDAIRKDYVEVAEKKPDEFMKTFANPLIDAYTVVERAVSGGFINITNVKNQAVWGSSGTFICSTANSSSPTIAIAEYLLSKKGDADYAEIKGLLN